MRLVAMRKVPEEEGLRQQWSALVLETNRPEVFYTWQWARAVEHAYGSAFTPLLYLFFEGEALVGLVALATSTSDKHEAFFLSGTTADYCDFLSSPSRRLDCVRQVFGELRKLQVKRLTLANLPADSATNAAMQAVAGKSGYHLLLRPAYQCAQIELGPYCEGRSLARSSHQKKALRRNLRALESKGSVTMVNLASDAARGLLPDFAQAHVARFLATGRISNLAYPERRAFLSELSQLLAASGWLRITRLMVGNHPVAWNYGFGFMGSWFWYQPTFDTNFEEFSPGICLLSKIVEAACADPTINLVDLGLGAEDYKERLATTSRQTLHLTLNHSLVRHVKETVRYHAAVLAQASPRLERRLRWLQRCVGRSGLWSGFWSLVSKTWKSLERGFWRRDEVLFFEWRDRGATVPLQRTESLSLKRITWELLATGVIHYCDDRETVEYLLRAAERLRDRKSEGFALVLAEGIPVHFGWVDDLDGFHIEELDAKVQDRGANCVVIFDCWTPLSARGRGYCAAANWELALHLRSLGKQAWTFSAASNEPFIRGVRKAGFVHQDSMIRTRRLLASRRVRVEAPREIEPHGQRFEFARRAND
jgi:CelD/BcsL family acetyltransferase involved in cellulose biosynthesis